MSEDDDAVMLRYVMTAGRRSERQSRDSDSERVYTCLFFFVVMTKTRVVEEEALSSDPDSFSQDEDHRSVSGYVSTSLGIIIYLFVCFLCFRKLFFVLCVAGFCL